MCIMKHFNIISYTKSASQETIKTEIVNEEKPQKFTKWLYIHVFKVHQDHKWTFKKKNRSLNKIAIIELHEKKHLDNF